MTWAEALKEHAKKTGKFVVPKKGTPEYDEVSKIHRKLKGEPEPEPEKVKRTRKKAIDSPEEVAPILPTKEEQNKTELDTLHAQGVIDKKKAKNEKIVANRKTHKEVIDAHKEKEDRYAKLEAEVAELKKNFKPKDIDANPAHIERIEKIKKEKVVKRAIADEKKAKSSAKKVPFKVEDKNIVLSFSD